MLCFVVKAVDYIIEAIDFLENTRQKKMREKLHV